MFLGLPNLRQLHFSDMNLDDDMWLQFRRGMDIVHLDLSHNRLEKLDQGVLDNLPLLKDLYLNHNQISALPREAFVKHFRLLTLDLSHNQIGIMPAPALSGATKLG